MISKLDMVCSALFLRLEHEIIKFWARTNIEFYCINADRAGPSLKQLRFVLRNAYNEAEVVKLFLQALKKVRQKCARAYCTARTQFLRALNAMLAILQERDLSTMNQSSFSYQGIPPPLPRGLYPARTQLLVHR